MVKKTKIKVEKTRAEEYITEHEGSDNFMKKGIKQIAALLSFCIMLFGCVYAQDSASTVLQEPIEFIKAQGKIIFPPVIRGQVIFILTEDGVEACDLTSKNTLWRFKFSFPVGCRTRIIMDKKHLYIGGGGRDHGIYALDRNTGVLVWGRKLDRPFIQFNCFENEWLIVATSGYLIALDSATGMELWKSDGHFIGPLIPESGEFLAVDADDAINYLARIDPQDGKWVREYSIPHPAFNLIPSIPGRIVYFGFKLADPEKNFKGFTCLVCLNRKNGKTVWKKRFDSHELLAVNMIVSNGRIFLVQTDFEYEKAVMLCLDATSGKEKWNVTLSGRYNDRNPVSYKDCFVIGIGEKIYGFSQEDGKVIFKIERKNTIGPIAVYDSNLYWAEQDKLWKLQLNN